MFKSISSERLPDYKNPARNELNLIGLKSRYTLLDRPDECKNICNAHSIKFNSTYGNNLFERINHCRNTFRDFDHIIVPKYMKNQTLRELISKEKDKIEILNKLNSMIIIKTISILPTLERGIKNVLPENSHNSDAEQAIRQQLLEFQQKQKTKVKTRTKSQSTLPAAKKKDQVVSVDNVKHKELVQASSVEDNNLAKTFFDKNDYVITSKGGVMHTASLWRRKNINNFLPSSPKQKESPNDDEPNSNVNVNQFGFHAIRAKPFNSKFTVKNLESFIKERLLKKE